MTKPFKPARDKLKIPSFTAGKPGRPPKSHLMALGQKSGVPAQREKELHAMFRGRLLNSGTGHRVIDKMIQVAMSDDHPHQVAMLKFIGDRILPLETFMDDAGKERGAVQVTIKLNSGVATASATVESTKQDVVDAQFREVDPE